MKARKIMTNKLFTHLSLATMILGFMSMSLPAYAANNGNRNGFGNINEIKENKEIKDVRQFKDSTHDATLKKATHSGILNNFLTSRAIIHVGKVTAIGTNSLTVTENNKTYTVNTDGNTKFRRRFFGSANFAEIRINDQLNVFGKWTDDAHTTILANLIRDMSIQKRFGVFVGDVTSVSGSTLVIKSVNRGTQTITVSGTPKLTNRKGQPIQLTDILSGHRIRIKGMWDNTNNTITEVKEIKDFSLPVVSGTPTPTITPSPIFTPAPTP
jgi:hypothetical protein